MRVAVIGTGIVGACVAWNLAADDNIDVLMFDRGQPGCGVTNSSFSWVNASNKTQTAEYFALNVAGMAAYRDLAGALGGSPWGHFTGHLRWAEDDAGVAALRSQVDQLSAWGYRVSWWPAGPVGRLLEPKVLFPSDDTEVAVYLDEGWIDGRALVTQVVESAIARGAAPSFDTEVTDIVVEAGRVTGVVAADQGRTRVDAVVNACGPAAGVMAGRVGRDLPLRHEPGLVVRLACPEVPIGRAMHAPDVEIRPDGDRRVLLHSRVIDARIDGGSEPLELARALQSRAAEVVPALEGAELVDHRVARRPIPHDGFPSLGAIEEVGGYYEAVTHSGITLGPVVGRLVAQEIIGGTVDPLVAPYRPDRFSRGGDEHPPPVSSAHA